MPINHKIKQAKAKLRKDIYHIQDSLAPTYFIEKYVLLHEAILQHPKVQEAQVVLSYWAMPKEAGTHLLNKELAKEKTVLLPVINRLELQLKRFEGIHKMKPEGKYGIFEPTGQEFNNFDKIDVILVPGLAFSLSKQRCGHGKGYYDMLLPKIPKAYTIGYCYHFQIVDNIPTDEYDFALDEIFYR